MSKLRQLSKDRLLQLNEYLDFLVQQDNKGQKSA